MLGPKSCFLPQKCQALCNSGAGPAWPVQFRVAVYDHYIFARMIKLLRRYIARSAIATQCHAPQGNRWFPVVEQCLDCQLLIYEYTCHARLAVAPTGALAIHSACYLNRACMKRVAIVHADDARWPLPASPAVCRRPAVCPVAMCPQQTLYG